MLLHLIQLFFFHNYTFAVISNKVKVKVFHPASLVNLYSETQFHIFSLMSHWLQKAKMLDIVVMLSFLVAGWRNLESLSHHCTRTLVQCRETPAHILKWKNTIDIPLAMAFTFQLTLPHKDCNLYQWFMYYEAQIVQNRSSCPEVWVRRETQYVKNAKRVNHQVFVNIQI